jgi:hypothetical protein
MTIECKFCNETFSELKKFESHLSQNHRNLTVIEKFEEFKLIKKALNSINPPALKAEKVRKSKKDLKKQAKSRKQTFVNIIVHSKRGTKLREENFCHSCKMKYRIVWKYIETNIGIAFLCHSCKHRILKPANHIRIIYSNPETSKTKY